MLSLAEFFAPSPEAENFYTFSTYLVVFTAKKRCISEGFVNQNVIHFLPPAIAQPRFV